MAHKLESRLKGEISITSDIMQMTLMAENEKQLKRFFLFVCLFFVFFFFFCDEGERVE